MKYLLVMILILKIIYCKSINQKSSSDDIIDYAAKKIAKEILSNYVEKEKKTIGVATFSKEDLENKKVNTLGLFLANSIHNEMFNPNRYDLVERTQIDKLVEEFKSYQNGLYSENDTKKLALHGVDYLLIGSLQKRQDTIRINTRLVSVQTGKIVSIASEAIPANNSITQLYEVETNNEKIDKEKGKKIISNIIISRKTETGLTPATAFFLDDQIHFYYKQGTPFETTRVELGLSECQRGLYYRKIFDINSSWTGLGYPADTTMLLGDFLTDYNQIDLPDSNCFDISFIIKDITIQKSTIYIDDRKYMYNN